MNDSTTQLDVDESGEPSERLLAARHALRTIREAARDLDGCGIPVLVRQANQMLAIVDAADEIVGGVQADT